MPLTFPDRFWWLQRYGGLLLAIGCFITTIYAAIQAYDAYTISQLPGDPIDTAILRDQAQEFLLGGGAFAIFVAQGILLILKSVDAQRRFRHRLRAIKGIRM